MKTNEAHKAGQHDTNPSRRCKLCWAAAREAQAKLAAVSHLDLVTLKLAVDEHVRPSYLASLKRCVDADLVVFANDGRGEAMLTDKGRAALKAVES